MFLFAKQFEVLSSNDRHIAVVSLFHRTAKTVCV